MRNKDRIWWSFLAWKRLYLWASNLSFLLNSTPKKRLSNSPKELQFPANGVSLLLVVLLEEMLLRTLRKLRPKTNGLSRLQSHPSTKIHLRASRQMFPNRTRMRLLSSDSQKVRKSKPLQKWLSKNPPLWLWRILNKETQPSRKDHLPLHRLTRATVEYPRSLLLRVPPINLHFSAKKLPIVSALILWKLPKDQKTHLQKLLFLSPLILLWVPRVLRLL